MIYGYIYKIVNNKNNKIYFGQTTNDFKTRYGNNLVKNTHNEYLKKSLIKYGIENFTIYEKFEIAYCKERLDKLEEFYISKYNTTDRRFGYNIQEGGSNGKHSEETKIKISKSCLNNNIGIKNHNSKRIVCLNNNEVFNSIADAKKKYGEKCKHIGENCIGKIKSSGIDKNGDKLVWMFLNDYLISSKKDIDFKIEKANKNKTENVNKKQVLCINNNVIYESVKDAERKTGIKKANIIACCKGRLKSAGKDEKTGEKIKWKYVKE